MRLVVLGGSGASTPELFEAIADWPGGFARRPVLDVVLVGRTLEKLTLVANACRARAPSGGPRVTVEIAKDRAVALEGADVVLNQVRIGGYAARAFDESFPWGAGLPGDETMGPGGLANALRTVPALADTWRDVAASARDALFVNLTNPAGIVQAAARRAGLRSVVSICDAPLPMLSAVSERLGRPLNEVRSRYVGLNHLGWYLPGPDELARLGGIARGVDPEVLELHGGVPGPYVRYHVHPDRLYVDQRAKETRAQSLQRLEQDLLRAYAAQPSTVVGERRAVWYRLSVVPLLDAWENGTEDVLIAGIANEGRVPEVPPEVSLEVPHAAPRPRRLVPLEPVARPPLIAALLAAQGAYEALALEAAAPDGSRDARLRALLANPMVRSYDQAVALERLIARSPFNARYATAVA